MQEIWNAEDKEHALKAVAAFEAAYGATFPKAVTRATGDAEELLAFYDFPAEHWIPSAHDIVAAFLACPTSLNSRCSVVAFSS